MVVRGEEKGKATTDGGGVEVGDGEGEEGGERKGKVSYRVAEGNGIGEESTAGAGVGDGQVT